MKSRESRWSVVGLIIWESIALIELGVDLYTGETTVTKLILTLAFCLLIAIFMYYLIRKRIRKVRDETRGEK